MLAISSLYAGLLALLLVFLSLRVVFARVAAGAALGDGGDLILTKRMRAQGNCAEYAPLFLILLLIAELQGMPSVALHLAGLVFFVARCIHAYGISQPKESLIFRQTGMIGSLISMILLALGLIGHSLF